MMARKHRGALAAILLAVGLVASACGGGAQTGNAGGSSPSTSEAASSGNGGGSQSAPSSVKIGAVLYNSGPGAAYGKSQTAGLQMAVDEINAKGGIDGTKIDLVIEDGAGQKEKSIAAVQKLINEDNVLAIIGPTLSTDMFAAGPIANDAGVPIMGISTTANGITDIGNYVFRNSLPESGVVPATITAAVKKFGIKKVAVLYGNDDDFTVSGYKVMKQALADQNIQVLDTETFTKGQTNFSAQLTKIKDLKPDALAVSALYTEAANLVKQARQMGITVPVIGGNGFNSPEYIKLAGEAAENTLVGSPWFAGRSDPKAQAFVKKYTDQNGAAPDQFAAQAYDGMYIFAEALGKNPPATLTDRDAFRDALASIKSYNGVTGTFSFDENRNPVETPTVLIVKDQQFTELK